MKTTDKKQEPMSVEIPTGEELRSWRKSLGWSRSEAAHMLLYNDPSAISQMETGHRKVPQRVALMKRLYDLTHIPFDKQETQSTEITS
jgi:predicted transcriptional regulator